MRNEPQEKHRLVKELAHEFTKYMCEYKAVPVFKMTPSHYAEMLTLPAEELEKIQVAVCDKNGMWGKMFGVEFFAVYGYEGPVKAVPRSDRDVFALSKKMSLS